MNESSNSKFKFVLLHALEKSFCHHDDNNKHDDAWGDCDHEPLEKQTKEGAALLMAECVDGEFLFASVLRISVLLFCVSLRSCLVYCLHCPHDFLWWLKVLLHFVCICELPVNMQKYGGNERRVRTAGCFSVYLMSSLTETLNTFLIMVLSVSSSSDILTCSRCHSYQC